MKYNICGYNQKALIKYGLDGNDALLLRTIMDIYSSSSDTLEYLIINEDKYMWLTYSYLAEQIQILGSVRTIKRKIDNFIEKDILKKVILSSKKGRTGKFMYLAPGNLYSTLNDFDFYKQNENDYSENIHMTKAGYQVTKCDNPHDTMSSEPVTICHDKDTSITDNSIADYNITHTGEENPMPVIEDILKKYKEYSLPTYDFRPKNSVILNCLYSLGAEKFFKALEIMGKSQFVKNNFSINTIFKVDNLKSALNGSFADRCSSYRKSPSDTRLNINNSKIYEENKDNEELYKILGLR